MPIKPENYPPFTAHIDANQYPTVMGVVGSAGTADVQGTAQPLPIGVRADSGAMYVYNLGPAGAVTVAGTDPTSYLPARLTDGTTFYTASGGGAGGSTVITVGTINVGTFTGNGVYNVTQPTLSDGQVGNLQSDVRGNLKVYLASALDSTNDSVTVTNMTSGSVRMTVGTLTAGTLTNLISGTINALATGTITAGTLTNLVSGTVNALAAGTITAGTLTNLVSGTVNALAAGTITTGTVSVTTGTLSPLPTIANSTFGTHGTTGATVFGTLAGGAGAGAGTEIFVTSVSMSIPATGGSQDVSIGFGTNAGTFHAGTGLLVRGMFPPGGGIQKTFWPPINSGTNGQLCLFQAGAGTIDANVTYFVTASVI